MLGSMVALGATAAAIYWLIEGFVHAFVLDDGPLLDHLAPTDHHELWMRLCVCALFLAFGFVGQALVERLRASQRQQEQLSRELEHALTRMISDFIPICASCKSVRDDDEWTPVESYIAHHTDTKFSHTMCPSCAQRLYPNHSPR